MAEKKPIRRSDRVGSQRTLFDKNKKRILATQDYCYLCGKLVDKSLPAGSDMSPEIDHIIPVSKGGSSDIDNLALTHKKCNRQKGNRVNLDSKPADHQVDILAWTENWFTFAK